MNNNNNNDYRKVLPLKPKVIAKRSTPVSHFSSGFKSAWELYQEQRQHGINIDESIQRNGAIVFPHPTEYCLEKNRHHLFASEVCHGRRDIPLKRTREQFYEENPDADEVANIESFWRSRYARKVNKLHNIRNRLRAVGLTNLELSEEVTVLKVQNSGLQGANSALHMQNTELQQQLKLKMTAIQEHFRDAIGMSLQASDDEELTPTLEELYSDEQLSSPAHPEEVEDVFSIHGIETPSVLNPPSVPNAPIKPTPVPCSNTPIASSNSSNGVPMMLDPHPNPQQHALILQAKSFMQQYEEDHPRHA